MFRAVCFALSLLFAVAAVACVDDAVTPTPLRRRPSAIVEGGEPLVAHIVPAAAGPAVAAVVATNVDVPVLVDPRSLLEKEALAIEDGDLVDHRAEGARLLARGDAMNAIGELKKALSIDSSADVWGQLGDAYLRVGDVERGLPCLDEAVTVDVDHLASRRLLTRHFLAAADGAHARQHAEEWVRLQPQDPSSRQALGRAFSQLGMWQQAIDEFALVVDVQPDNAYAFNNLGYAALQLGDNDRAVDSLERVLSLKPQQGYMLNNLGVAYERVGRTAEAHAAFARAAELSPKYAQAALNRDRVQRGMNQAQRIVSNDTLLKLRDGLFDDVPPLGTGRADGTGDNGERVDLPGLPSVGGE